jgi:glycosyltransferase involved in cell wall biosynthesis
MIDQPLVSIIIATFNQRDFVSESIDSALNQNYTNIEIIVTDDGSNDGTIEILQEYASNYPNKIKLITSEKNTGITKNGNRGLNVATGEFIAWLGGDDLMMPDKIKKQVEVLISRPDAVGCCHDAEVFESGSGKIIGLFSELYNGKKGFKEGGIEMWFKPGYFMLPSTIMFRSKFKPTHGFDERLLFGDWLFDIEVFKNGKCAVINEVLGKYRRHSHNITSSLISRTKGLEENLIILGIVESRYPELYPFVKKMRKALFLTAAGSSFNNGDIPRSNNYIKNMIYDGAIISGVIAFLSLRLFNKYISHQISKEAFSRSRWFVILSNILKR